MNKCLNQRSGFTVIELMLVVAIITLLGSVALPAMGKYVRKVKTVEAMTNLRNLYDAEIGWYYKHREKVTRDGDKIFQPFASSCSWSTGPSCWSFTLSRATAKGTPAWNVTPPGSKKAGFDYWPPQGHSYDVNPYDYYKSFATVGVSFDADSYFAYESNYCEPSVTAKSFFPGSCTRGTFYVRAISDFDEDGTYGDYRRVGYVDRDFRAQGGAGVYIENPEE